MSFPSEMFWETMPPIFDNKGGFQRLWKGSQKKNESGCYKLLRPAISVTVINIQTAWLQQKNYGSQRYYRQ